MAVASDHSEIKQPISADADHEIAEFQVGQPSQPFFVNWNLLKKRVDFPDISFDRREDVEGRRVYYLPDVSARTFTAFTIWLHRLDLIAPTVTRRDSNGQQLRTDTKYALRDSEPTQAKLETTPSRGRVQEQPVNTIEAAKPKGIRKNKTRKGRSKAFAKTVHDKSEAENYPVSPSNDQERDMEGMMLGDWHESDLLSLYLFAVQHVISQLKDDIVMFWQVNDFHFKTCALGKTVSCLFRAGAVDSLLYKYFAASYAVYFDIGQKTTAVNNFHRLPGMFKEDVALVGMRFNRSGMVNPLREKYPEFWCEFHGHENKSHRALIACGVRSVLTLRRYT